MRELSKSRNTLNLFLHHAACPLQHARTTAREAGESGSTGAAVVQRKASKSCFRVGSSLNLDSQSTFPDKLTSHGHTLLAFGRIRVGHNCSRGEVEITAWRPCSLPRECRVSRTLSGLMKDIRSEQQSTIFQVVASGGCTPEVAIMEFMANLQGGVDDLKPSLFGTSSRSYSVYTCDCANHLCRTAV
jgi:hypothetical protein